MNKMKFHINHKNIFVRAMERRRQDFSESVNAFCRRAKINSRTYQSWLQNLRLPDIKEMRDRFEIEYHSSHFGPRSGLTVFNLENINKNWVLVVCAKSGELDAARGTCPVSALINLCNKVESRYGPGISATRPEVLFKVK